MADSLDDSSLPGRPGFIAQTWIAGPVLWVVMLCWFVHVAAYYDGGLTAVAWMLGAAYYSVITVSVVSVAGLPLRRSRAARAWCTAHWWVSLVGSAVALALIVLSSVRANDATYLDEHGIPEYVSEANLPLALVGWFVLAFCLMHTWWPRRGHRTSAEAAR
jgi:Na+/phosphate symporter